MSPRYVTSLPLYFSLPLVLILIDFALQTALQNLENSFNYLKGHESQALDYFSQANGQYSDIVSNSKFNGLPQREEFITKFEARAKEFQDTYAAYVLNNEVRDATQSLKQNLSNANSYFSSHRYDQAMDFFHETKSKVDQINALSIGAICVF